MPSLVIQLPARADQTEFNLRRWAELLDNPDLARIEGRIETDRHGQIIMSPPPGANHGTYQATIVFHLRQLLLNGRVITECPISTADGVKAADVAWASRKAVRSLGNRQVYVEPPEICVEILSPRNTKGEIEEKRRLYFDAGAKEVWVCSMKGEMSFYLNGSEKNAGKSMLCPEFPKKVTLD
ncbi:MAG TPA: Uma2 family endonuclease [Verrucomicrobiae bacterium]